MAKAKKNISLILTVIVGMAIFICAAYNKRVTFCDEIYTYMIVDSGNAAYQLAQGQWYLREQIRDVLSHTEGDSIVQMLRNVKGDSHPPLYYAIVYVFAVLFGANISKWVALSVNAIMYLGTLILFWSLLYKLFKSPLRATIGTLMYEINVGTLSDAMLLRMYMQLTFFVIAFAYVTLLLYKNKDKLAYYVLLGVITAGGFLTQFYFCFVAISFFIIWTIYNIITKKYSRIIKYLVSMVTAVIVDTVVWHYWISAILFNSDSETIKENALNFANIFNSFFKGILTVQLPIFQNWYIFGSIFVIALTAWTLLSKRVSRTDEDIKLFIASLAGVVWMYGSIVYYLTPDYLLSGRYFYAASALEYLLIVVCACTLIRAYVPDGVSARAVQAFAVVGGIAINIFIFFSGDGIDYYTDAQEYDKQRAVLEQYADYPWIICGDETWKISANYFDYIIPEKLMRITEDSPYRQEAELEQKDGFIIVAEDGENSQSDLGLYYYIGCTGRFAKSELLFVRNNLAYYFAYPVE